MDRSGLAVKEIENERIAPAGPPAPDGKPHLPHDAPVDLGGADGGAGVGGRLAGHHDLGVEPRGFGGRIEFYFELGSLVFLYVEVGVAGWAVAGHQGHSTQEPVSGGRKAAAERPVVVALVLSAFDLLAVGVTEYHGQSLAGQRVIVVGDGVRVDADALVVDRMARTVEGPVGEEDRLFARFRVRIPGPGSVDVLRGQLVAVVFGND